MCFVCRRVVHRGTLPVAELSQCLYCLSCIGSGGTARAKIKDKRSIVLLYNLPLWNVCAAIMLSCHREMLELTLIRLLLWLIYSQVQSELYSLNDRNVQRRFLTVLVSQSFAFASFPQTSWTFGFIHTTWPAAVQRVPRSLLAVTDGLDDESHRNGLGWAGAPVWLRGRFLHACWLWQTPTWVMYSWALTKPSVI